MSECDAISKGIQRVSVVGSGGGTTSTTPLLETTNTVVACADGAATEVLPANTARRFAQIQNMSATSLRIRIGANATNNSFELPASSVFTVEIDTLFGIPQGNVTIWNPSGASVDVRVIEWTV